MADTDTAPGALDVSEATDSALTLEEANEKGFYGYVFDDGDYTVAGVTGSEQSAQSAPPKPVPSPDKGDAPKHKDRDR
jgi:hypothetical protein